MQNMSSVQPELTSMRFLRVCCYTSVFQSSRDVPVKATQIHALLQIVLNQEIFYLYKVPWEQISFGNQFLLLGAFFFLFFLIHVLFWMEEGMMELGERR